MIDLTELTSAPTSWVEVADQLSSFVILEPTVGLAVGILLPHNVTNIFFGSSKPQISGNTKKNPRCFAQFSKVKRLCYASEIFNFNPAGGMHCHSPNDGINPI